MKYKVGDKVRVIEDIDKVFKEGEIVTIDGPNGDDTYKCYDKEGIQGNLCEDEIEPLTTLEQLIIENPEKEKALRELFITHNIGDRFLRNEHEYLLCKIGEHYINLVCLESGNIWSRHQRVEDICNITNKELKALQGDRKFTKL